VSRSSSLIGSSLGAYEIQALLSQAKHAACCDRHPAALIVPTAATALLPELRTLVAAGRTDGQVRDGGAELLAKRDAAERILSREMQLAKTTLHVLQ
jgi:hypothetical protein